MDKKADGKQRLYKELAELGADVDAFKKADLTEEELAKLVSGLRRAANTKNKGKKKA